MKHHLTQPSPSFHADGTRATAPAGAHAPGAGASGVAWRHLTAEATLEGGGHGEQSLEVP